MKKVVCETVTCSALFTSEKAVQFTWYEFSIYLHYIYYIANL